MRLNFIRKVYLILMCQLILTAGFVILSTSLKSYRTFVAENLWLLIVCLIVNLTIFYVMIYVRAASRKVPVNYILLTIFTLTECYLVSSITAFYQPKTVLIAAVLTAVMSIALTAYAWFTKTDLTILGGFLFCGFVCLMFGFILLFFFPSRIFSIVISVLCVILFSIYLVYDTQLIVGNGEHKLMENDYIWGALRLYIDIVTIFVHILNLLGK